MKTGDADRSVLAFESQEPSEPGLPFRVRLQLAKPKLQEIGPIRPIIGEDEATEPLSCRPVSRQ